MPTCPHRAPWHATFSAHVLPDCGPVPQHPRPSSLCPARPPSPPHPLLLSDALPQEDAGGAHGELHGAGRRAELTGADVKTAPPPPLGGSVSLSLLSLLCQLFLPLLASPSVPMSYSCDSWVGNLPWGRGGIRIVPASPSGLSLTGGEPASGTVTSYPQNGIGKVVLKVGIRAEGMLSARSKPGLCWLWAREEGGDMALTSEYFGNVHQ